MNTVPKSQKYLLEVSLLLGELSYQAQCQGTKRKDINFMRSSTTTSTSLDEEDSNVIDDSIDLDLSRIQKVCS